MDKYVAVVERRERMSLNFGILDVPLLLLLDEQFAFKIEQ